MFQTTYRLLLLLTAVCLLSQQARAIPVTQTLDLAAGTGSTSFLGATPADGPFTATLVLETGGPGAPAATDTLVIGAASIVSFNLMIGTAVWDETLLDFTGFSTGVATSGLMTGTTLTSLLLSAVTPTLEFLTIDLTNDPKNWSAVSTTTGEAMLGTNSGSPATGGGAAQCTANCDAAVQISEPGSLGLMVLGLVFMAGLIRQRGRSRENSLVRIYH